MENPAEKRLRRAEKNQKKLLQAQKALQDRLEKVRNSKLGPDDSWTDFNAPSLLPLIEAARNTNPDRASEGEEAARELLFVFIEAVVGQCRENGRPHAVTFDKETGHAIIPTHLRVDADLCTYVADCFRLIIRKKHPVPAQSALNLSKSSKRGPKASSETKKNHLRWGYEVATEYRRLKGLPPRQIFRVADLPVYQARTMDTNPDRKMQRAVNIVAKRYKKKSNTILDAYNTFREWSKRNSTSWKHA